MIYSKLRIQLLRNHIAAWNSQLSTKSKLQLGRFYSHQESLPHLPVPPLQQTLDKYLKTIRPLVNDAEFKKTQALVKELSGKNGLGEQLQAKLFERCKHKENWLSDWWLDHAYLKSRAPVVVSCSPSVSFPRYNFQGLEGQIEQAAKVIAAILDYKVDIDSETLPIEKLGGKPLCMDQYYKILSSCRIPGIDKDGVKSYARSWKPPQHITVIHKNNFFELSVYNSDGEPLSVQQLQIQLEKIVEMSTESGIPVGILTTLDRNTWGKVYAELTADEHNEKVINSIQRSIFALCLDQLSGKSTKNWRSSFALTCLHGGGSNSNTGNRWFDKTVQMVVDQDGGVGLVYEHSPAEGPPIAALLDHIYKYCQKSSEHCESSVSLPVPKSLVFNVSAKVSKAIDEACVAADSVCESVKLEVADFKDFGKEFVKSKKMSPDSFIQIALQLAYWRLHKQPPATYESASLRQFRLGRTDTIRSCSVSSQAFVEAMDEANVTNSEKAKLLREAVAAHRRYTNEAVSGQGIDRHLLGLRLAAIESGLPEPSFLKQDAYKRAMHFNLSTSQVPSQADLCMAFGPAVPDGYGVCYNPKADKVLIAVSTFVSNCDYNPVKYCEVLFKSLCDMRDLLVGESAKL